MLKEKKIKVCFIGNPNVGKSTLINLIPRFYDITNGSLTIDNININSLSLKELRSMIAYVGQDLEIAGYQLCEALSAQFPDGDVHVLIGVADKADLKRILRQKDSTV